MDFRRRISRARRRLPALASGLLAAGLLLWSAPAQAALMFFDNRAEFELASGLSGITEDFEEANVNPNNASPFGGALSSSTNNPIFSTGDISPGITFSATFGGLIALGDGLAGPTKKIAAQVFEVPIFIGLDPGVTAIGFDLFLNFGVTSIVDITLFDTSGGTLGTTRLFDVTTGFNPTEPATFFGVISDMGQIGQLRVASLELAGEVIDNVTFGNAAQQLPEPGTLALFGLGLLGLGVAARRRHRLC